MSHKHDPNFNAKLNGKEKFGFRKLSIGLAAVALGTSFFVSNGQLVHAADSSAIENVTGQGTSENDQGNASAFANNPATENENSNSAADNPAAENENSNSAADNPAAENENSDSAADNLPAENENNDSAVNTTEKMQASSSAETENKQAADNSATESADAEPTNFQSKAKVQQAEENKVSYDITVYDSAENAKSANQAGKIASSPAEPANLTPGNQNIYLRFNISGLTENDTPLTISFDNAGGLRDSSKDFVISYNAGTTSLLEQNKPVWSLVNNGDGTLTLSRVENTNATNADFYIPIQANRAINPSLSDEGKDVSLTPVISTSTGSVISPATSGPILYAKITPAKDYVQRAEILYGFSMEEKSLTDEIKYNPGLSVGDSTNISLEHELELLKANSDDSVKEFIDSAVSNNVVYQWGYYFNYPKTSLENAAFRSYFDKMQIPLYSTLKVFEVPADLVSYTNSAGETVRIGENQKLSELPTEIQNHYIDGKNITGDTTVYSIIVSTPTVTGLQDYLRGLIKQQTRTTNDGYDSSISAEENGFTYDQTDLSQYAGKAYFFQLDTLPSAGSGTSMHFEDGRAGTYNVPLNRNGNAGGFGGGSTITTRESKTITEQIKYVDEDQIGADSAEEIFAAAFGQNGDQYAISSDYKSIPVSLTREIITEEATGIQSYGDWTVSGGFDLVNNPAIANYKLDAGKIYEQFMDAASTLAASSAENIGSVSADSILAAADDIADGAVLQIVVPYKQTVSISQESKTITEQIKYVDEDQIGADSAEEIFAAAFGQNGDQYAISSDYKSIPVSLTRTVYTNDVTGQKSYGDWTVSGGFDLVNNPAIANYKLDVGKIYEQFMDAASTLAASSAENIGSVSADSILAAADDIADGAVLQIVVPYKQTVSISQESKTITEQIKYVDEDRIRADSAEEIFAAAFGQNGDQYAISSDYKSIPVSLTRTVYTNDVTGQKSYGGWTVSGGFDLVNNPAIANYKLDVGKIYEQFMDAASTLAASSAENIGSVSADSILAAADDIADGAVLQIVVPYKTIPTTPDVPTTPTTPDVPTTPTTPDVPTAPATPNIPAVPNKPTIRQLNQSNRSSKHSDNATGQTGKTTLPQTGEKKSNYNLAGMILTLLSAFLFAFPGKKRND